MATKQELSEQLVLTQKLASVVDSMARTMEKMETSYETQVASAEKLAKALEGIKSQDIGSQQQRANLDEFKKKFKTVDDAAKHLTGRLKDFSDGVKNRFPKSLAIGATALDVMEQGFNNVLAASKGVLGFLGSFTKGVFSVAAAIISIPFQMFNALIDTAAAADGGMNELAAAIEKVRREFGDLKGPAAGAILETSKTLQGFAATGLDTWRIFGTMAERLEHVTKIAQTMGASFGVLKDEFKKNGGTLLAFEKGLDGSGEGMKGIADTAIRLGKPMTKVFLDMTKQTLALGKAFDIDQKLIGKDMVKALADVKNFGALTVKEIGQASVYARKLGLELDKITGTLDAFETFDTAAENAAKLSQAFGVNIDAFKMMEAQSPAEQLDMLRKSFRDAGLDASKFSRQQAKLLEQSTGLDAATVRQAFSTSNYGVSLDDVKKKSEAAEKKTLTQAEAMAKLADSIERMVKSGGAQSGGFWEMFVKGFLQGIQSSKEFREIIMNIKRSLQLVYFEGVKLGKAFVELFPGVQKFLKGIADFFQPAKFKTLVGGVTSVLIQWMSDLKSGQGKVSFSSLMDKLREKFFSFFDSQDSAGRRMLEGFKTFFKTFTKIIAEAIKWASDKVGEGIKFIIDLVTGEKKLGALGAASEGGLGFLAEALAPLGEALVHAWHAIAPKLWELLKIVAGKLYDYLTSPEFINIIKPALPKLALVLFGPAFARALVSAITVSAANALMNWMTGSSSKKLMEGVAKNAADKVMEASKKVADTGADTSGMKAIAAADGGGKEVTKDSGWGVKDAVKLGLKLAALAVVLITSGIALAYALVHMKKVLEAGGIKSAKDAEAPLTVLAALVLGSVPLMIALRISGAVANPGAIAKGGAAISAAVLMMGVVATGLTYVLTQVGSPKQLDAAGTLMMKMTSVFLATVPLIGAAILIGAAVAGTGGIALALAGGGMAILGVAVGEMAIITVGIVRELSKIPGGGELQAKVDAFLSIMKSIQVFSETLVSLIRLMTPSFTELLKGVSFTEKVNSSISLIKEMVGQRGSGSGMIGIIETVLHAIKQMDVGGPGMAEAAKVFAEVLGGITEFVKAAQPPEAFYKEGGSFINKLVDPSHNFNSLATDVARYAQLMREGAMEMLTGTKDGNGNGGVLGIVKRLSSFNIPSPENASTVANLISGTAQVLKAITPSGDTLQAFTNTKETSAAWGLITSKTSELNTDAISTTITTMGEQFNTLLKTLTSDVLKTVVEQADTLSPKDIEGVKALGGIMATVGSITSAIASAAKGKRVTPQEVAGATAFMVEEAPDMEALFKGIGESLPALLKSVVGVVNDLGSSLNEGFLKKAKDVENLFGFVKTLTDVAGTLSGAGTGKMIDPTTMVAAFQKLAWFMWAILHGGGGFGRGAHGVDADSPLKLIMNDLKDPVLKSLGDAKNGVLKTAENLAGMFKALSEVSTTLSKISGAELNVLGGMGINNILTSIVIAFASLDVWLPKLTTMMSPEKMKMLSSAATSIEQFGANTKKISDAIATGGVGTALDAVSEVVKQVQALDDALHQMDKIDVSTKLGNIAKAAGLGSKGIYTVKSKEVILTVNLNVTMDVGEVERVMIMRQQSIIRDRLNFALDQPSEKASPLIPETRQLNLPNATVGGT